MFDTYESIKSSKDESKLVEMVRSGELKPTMTCKEGQTPLMIAVDSGFSVKTVEELIELGCDVNA